MGESGAKGNVLVFRGRSTHVLDSKGRLSIPARFREVLRSQYDERLMVTNLPNCLVAYPLDVWKKIEDKFTSYDIAPPKVQLFQRYFLASAVMCNLDSHGRILILSALREEAGLNKDVVLLCILNRFEIWDKDALESELQKARENVDELSEFVASLSI